MVPDFTKPLQCVQDEFAHMITERASLLSHIRSCQYLPNINTVEKINKCQLLFTFFLTMAEGSQVTKHS